MTRITHPPFRYDYERSSHAAVRSQSFVFNQLIPYIGNKRKLLGLLGEALHATDLDPTKSVFADFFSGSSVVSRFAKHLGFTVISNDWEPYSTVIGHAYIKRNREPSLASLGGYQEAIATLNGLPGVEGWVTRHLCPRDDEDYDIHSDRMFYMRKNGMRIDAIRECIAEWESAGSIDDDEASCLIAPLLYQASYTSNTSGVFKGFHAGWGGRNGTALYRIGSDLRLLPTIFHDNMRANEVYSLDAQLLAERLSGRRLDIAYFDPPYNQHPYASNYHVLNSITLWDKPVLPRTITKGTKSAIRSDWIQRRSAYNSRNYARGAYTKLLSTVDARYLLTSYSTDGTIPLLELIQANVDRGATTLLTRPYKRYRVSPTRPSDKPINVEFVVVTDTEGASNGVRAADLVKEIRKQEVASLARHPERRPSLQLSLLPDEADYG